MKPFLKWAGNKKKLAHIITPELGQGKRLIIPFSGSAAIALDNVCNFHGFLLADINPDLINLFQMIQQYGTAFIEYARILFEGNDAKTYYEKRERFNAISSADRATEKAALFLYLNRHGFNGLCRYSKLSGFNVPFGQHKKPYFPADEMTVFYRFAQNKGDCLQILCQDFEQSFKKATADDVIYGDPPYLPLSDTANFTEYGNGRFTMEDQKRLAALAEQSPARVVISNHDTPAARELYQSASKVISFPVRRNIAAKKESRGKVKEILAIWN